MVYFYNYKYYIYKAVDVRLIRRAFHGRKFLQQVDIDGYIGKTNGFGQTEAADWSVGDWLRNAVDS